MMTTTIWWVRRDLRLTDNQALYAACQAAEQVLPIFVLDPILLNSSYACEKRTAFLMGSLQALDRSLQERGSRLIVRQGDPQQVLFALMCESGATAIFAERDHSPYAKRRDEQIAKTLPLHLSDGVAMRAPKTVLKNDGQPYTVYTPYSKRWKSLLLPRRVDILPAPTQLTTPSQIASLPIPNTDVTMNNMAFPPSETEAKKRLGAFVGHHSTAIFDYAQNRDFPYIDGTAQLSPYLRFGMISARLAVLGALKAMHDAHEMSNEEGAKSAETWLNELIWRDFYTAVLDHFPHVRRGSFRPEYDKIVWENDRVAFEAWCQGQTGYPFVDAAMRQLQTIGWMHNRARMVVSSFLVKDILIDWQWGERWFMQQLIDGDPAANNGGWQWSAGTGTDAAPYFRIFNPISQGKKFDPDGVYVRKWVPELVHVPKKFIHEPWKMGRSEETKARCVVGIDYPEPIVNHAWARKRTLEVYKAAKQ